MSFLRMDELDLTGKRVMIREDFNVPLDAGRVTSDARLAGRAYQPFKWHWMVAQPLSCCPTSDGLLKVNTVMNFHWRRWLNTCPAYWIGRCVCSKTGWPGLIFSPVKLFCAKTCVSMPVRKATMMHWPGPWHALCDIFVMDAFGTAHRAQASTEGVIRFAPVGLCRAITQP